MTVGVIIAAQLFC